MPAAIASGLLASVAAGPPIGTPGGTGIPGPDIPGTGTELVGAGTAAAVPGADDVGGGAGVPASFFNRALRSIFFFGSSAISPGPSCAVRERTAKTLVFP